jgi:hypothetical protein
VLRNIKVTYHQLWDELEARTICPLKKHNGKFSDNLDPMSTSLLDVLKIAVHSQLPQDVPEPERMLFVRSTNLVQSSIE